MNVADSRPKRPDQLQKRASWRWWLLSIPLTAASGCTFEELPPLPDHAVGGSLHGLWVGASAELTLTSSNGVEETLMLSADGAFTFVHRFSAETTYTVALTEAPIDHDCAIANGAGTVANTDIESIAITCDGPIPIAIALANPIDAPIDTSLVSQTIPVSLLQQEARVIVQAPGATQITLDGASIASGFPSPAKPLVTGETSMSVEVRVESLSRTFNIVVDRRQAHVTTEYAFLKASNLESGDKFGYAIAAMDDEIWIGAPDEDSATTSGSGNGATDSGAVYVFSRNGSAWKQSALFKRTFDPGARLGRAIAVSPNVAFVSAPNEDVEHLGVGSLYWFLPNAGGWLALGRLGPADTTVTGYGRALALDGDTLAVSDDLPGSVHILRGPTWNEEKLIRPANVETIDGFGFSLALSGDLLVVGSRNDSSTGTGVFGTMVPTDNDTLYSGAVYVFRSDGGAWNLDSFIKAPNPDPYDKFGYVVAFDGRTLVVGVPDEASGSQSQSDNSAPSAGAVYTYVRENGTWRQEAYLKAPAPHTNQYFGITVDIRGDLLAVGEFSETGTVHLFQRQASGWTWIAAVNPSNGDMNDYFSSAIALTKTGLVATSPFEDGDGSAPSNNASPNSGAVYALR